MDAPIHNVHLANALFPLACACQNLRRLTRLVTRIYDQELRNAGIEITQFGLLTALAIVGEANQKALSAGFAMDSTTLTRTLVCCASRAGSTSSQEKIGAKGYFA
jgi:hypothetical protein